MRKIDKYNFIFLNIEYLNMSLNLDIIYCKAIIEQGLNKGKQCTRPNTKDGYCGKHCKQLTLTKAKEEDKHKCSTHRCNIILEVTSVSKYCDSCLENKKNKIERSSTCKALIQQGAKKGTHCPFIFEEQKEYCEKHRERNTIIDEAIKKNQRICDDGKRSCKNITLENKLKCEECLEKTREKENVEYKIRQLNERLCLGCGKELLKYTEGIRKEVQRCSECYEKLCGIEEKRIREERNYNIERKNNLMTQYAEYRRGAIVRNLNFDINIDDFNNLVNGKCCYCGKYNENEVIGIDRVDSSKGYNVKNCVSCCKICNIMKGKLVLNEFELKITEIYNYYILNKLTDTIIINKESNTSYIRPREITSMYFNKTLDKYIQLCRDENRSILFIEKLENLLDLKLNITECIAYIKNILRCEANFIAKTENQTRQRISRKELFDLLEKNNFNKCILLYQSVHGNDIEFESDMKEFNILWSTLTIQQQKNKFDKILIKYQNKRKNTKHSSNAQSSNSLSV